MFLNDEAMTLENIAHGVAEEKFQIELQRVLDNMVDPNTEAKKTREIVLKLKFTPNEARNMALITVESDCKLVPHKAYASACTIEADGKKGLAREVQQGRQQPLFPDEEDLNGKVVQFGRAEGGLE